MPLITILNGKPTGPQADKLFEHVKQTRPGDIITHETIERLFGVTRADDQARYRTLISVAKRRIFREQSIALRPVPGVGYEHPEGWAQMGQCVAGIRCGAKKMYRSVKIGAVVSDERLPKQAHRNARDYIVTRARYVAELAKSEKKSLELAIGRPEVLPSLGGN